MRYGYGYGNALIGPSFDAGGGGVVTVDTALSYWTGPGGWIYAVQGATGPVYALWSPTSKREINKLLDTATAGKVRAELARSGKKFTSKEAAYAAAGISAGGLSAYLPSLPSLPSLPFPDVTGGQQDGQKPTAITEQPWFWPAIVAGGGILFLVAMSGGGSRKSSKPAKPASAFRAMFA